MREYRTPPEAKPDRRLLWAMRVALALGFYALLGFVGVPALIEWQLPKVASEQLGRSVSLTGARFNPFTLSLSVDGLSVKEADSEVNAAVIDHLETDLQWRSLFRWGLVISRLQVDGPHVALIRYDEARTNWSDVIERLAAPADAPPPEPTSSGGPRFSVNNIRVTGGGIDIDDRVAGMIHTVRDLTVGIPFISGFPAQVEHDVQPELSALINDAPFALSGRTRPFDPNHATVFDLQLAPFDIAPYLAYLPYTPDFRIRGGQLATALELAFEQPESGPPKLTIVGTATLTGLELTEPDDALLLKLDRAHVQIADFEVFAGRLALAELSLSSPQVRLVRAADGRLNWSALAPPSSAPSSEAEGEPIEAEGAGFAFSVARVRLQDGQVTVIDAAAPAGRFETRLEGLNLNVDGLDTAADTAAEVTVEAASGVQETVSISGQLRPAPFTFDGQIELSGAPLTHYAAYYASALNKARLSAGVLSARVPLKVSAEGVAILDAEARVEGLALVLAGAKAPALAVPKLAADGVSLPGLDGPLEIGRISTSGGKLSLVRQRDGQLDLAAIAATDDTGSTPSSSGEGMAVHIGTVSVDDWAVSVRDETASPAMQLAVTRLAATVRDVAPGSNKAVPVELSAVLNRSGYLAVKGRTRLDDFTTDLRVDLKALEVRDFAGYIPRSVQVDLRSGQLSLAGQLAVSGLAGAAPAVSYRGALQVDALGARDTINDTDFLRWKRLRLEGIDLATEPARYGVDSVVLSDFYSRLILSSEGQLNFRELTAGERAQSATQDGSTSTAPVEPPPTDLPPIRVGKVSVDGGNVHFTDNFVRPNYDANLTEVAGTLEDLRSDPQSVATLSLTAAIDHAAPVEVNGQLNPLRQDRFLDILATVRDFELPTISTYSGKYVGYGIAKGKLSADLEYKIEDRVLTAQNHVVLDQLTFGDKVQSETAVNLPVQLAVALLKNADGTIDLSVPVSGTLDDPKFSIGALVWKAFFNLITKAVTSPFALLGSVFGGGEELAYVDFAPGSDMLTNKAVKKLETLSKALAERPALKLDMTGRVNPAADADGLRQRWIDDRMRALLRDEMADDDKPAPALEQIEIPAARRDELLEAVYDEADIEKPRNALGFAKDVPPEQMRALLRAAAPADVDALATLGKQRAQRVRDWLIGEGKVSASRIFMVAPTAGMAAQDKARVDFSLK